MIVFGLAGVFSSAVTKAAGNEVLVVSPNCGRLVYDGDPNNTTVSGEKLVSSVTSSRFSRGDLIRSALGGGAAGALAKFRDDIRVADDYARVCYTFPPARSQSRCQIYTV